MVKILQTKKRGLHKKTIWCGRENYFGPDFSKRINIITNQFETK